MHVAITGATGFLGAALTRALSQTGHSVRIIRRNHSDTSILKDISYEDFIADITDSKSLKQAFSGCELVFHTAATVSMAGRYNDQYDNNVLGTTNVLNACLDQDVKRVVHTSSVAAIGYRHDGSATEKTSFSWPSDNLGYMQTKHEAELAVYRAIEQGLDAVIVNPSIIFGRNDPKQKMKPLLQSLQNGKIPFYPIGSTNVCDLDDVVKGHLLAAEKGKTGERYILGGANISYRNLLDTIANEISGRPPRWAISNSSAWILKNLIRFIPDRKREKLALTDDLLDLAQLRVEFSSKKAIDELGYTITPFKETIKKTADWYRELGHLR